VPLASVSRKIALLFWILAIAAIPIWSRTDPPGYDVVFYHNAIRALHIGDDPYLDATAIQDAFHREYGLHSNGYPPCSYVYSPITLPLLRLIGDLPVWFAGTLYWLLLIASALSLLWVGTLAGLPSESIFLRLFLPLALFVPGLLAHDTILSGNVAFILYGLVLVTAAYGWKRNRWLWCYLAIIVASCFKAPLLCLVAIPLFSARRQWIPAALTTGTGVLLFAMQPLLWPALFRHFLRAVQLQFTYNHDFGSSPAGVFSNILVHKGLPYSVPGMVFYVIYAVLIFATLLYLSRLFLDGLISLQQWLLVVILLLRMTNQQRSRRRRSPHSILPKNQVQLVRIRPIRMAEVHLHRRRRPRSLRLVRRIDQPVHTVRHIRHKRSLIPGPVNSVEISEANASLLFIGGTPSSVSIVRSTLTVE
jgi:hypothetical protein